MTRLYDSLREQAGKAGETNDCAIRSLVVTTGRSYGACAKALRLAGRKKGDGTYDRELFTALRALGFRIARTEQPKRVTTRTIEGTLGGAWIVRTAHHFAGMVDHTLHDYAGSRRFPVLVCWKIEKVKA